MEITGWGRTRRAQVLAARPESAQEVLAALADVGDNTVIVHAGGRSYGDVALNDGGKVVLTGRLNRFLDFNEETLDLVCEPGVTFGDVLEVFGPRGYLFPVSPGTAYTTIGGAVASDLHGKNHEFAGSFGNHVQWMDLALPSGEVCRVSRTNDPELFTATIGGLGLTGFMLRVCFRMMRVPSTDMIVQERRAPDLDAFITAFEAHRQEATYSVGWIDGLARSGRLGRGIIETGELAEPPSDDRKERRHLAVPFDFPKRALNRTTVGWFNTLYYRRVPQGGRTRRVPIGRYLYPLDSVLRWNRVYGRQGFHQFQCVLPNEAAPHGLHSILKTVVESKAMPFLGVIKTFGSDGLGYLSFPLRGYTLALDFPHKDEDTIRVLRTLHEITAEHGGRVYLAKDSALTPEMFRRMYPRHGDYRSVLERVDPNQLFSSDLSRRLRIRE